MEFISALDPFPLHLKCGILQRSAHSFIKGQIEDTLGSMGHTVSVATKCIYCVQAARDDMSVSGLGWVAIKFIYRNRWWARFGQRATVCWPWVWRAMDKRLDDQALWNLGPEEKGGPDCVFEFGRGLFSGCLCVCVFNSSDPIMWFPLEGSEQVKWTQVKKSLWLKIKHSWPYGSLGLESVCLSQGCKGCKEQKFLLFKNIHTFTHTHTVRLVGMVRVPQGGWSWEPRGYRPPAPLYNPCSFAGHPSWLSAHSEWRPQPQVHVPS